MRQSDKDKPKGPAPQSRTGHPKELLALYGGATRPRSLNLVGVVV